MKHTHTQWYILVLFISMYFLCTITVHLCILFTSTLYRHIQYLGGAPNITVFVIGNGKQQLKFKSCTKLFAFQFMPFGIIWNLLISLQLLVNSRADEVLIMQPVWEKESFEFKPAVLCLKFNLVFVWFGLVLWHY